MRIGSRVWPQGQSSFQKAMLLLHMSSGILNLDHSGKLPSSRIDHLLKPRWPGSRATTLPPSYSCWRLNKVIQKSGSHIENAQEMHTYQRKVASFSPILADTNIKLVTHYGYFLQSLTRSVGLTFLILAPPKNTVKFILCTKPKGYKMWTK